MSNFFRTLIECIVAFIAIMALLFGFLCIIGILFINGTTEQSIEKVNDNCYTITTYRNNWYPSSGKVISEETVCK